VLGETRHIRINGNFRFQRHRRQRARRDRDERQPVHPHDRRSTLEVLDPSGRLLGRIRLGRPTWDGASGLVWVSRRRDRVVLARSQDRTTYLLRGRIG